MSNVSQGCACEPCGCTVSPEKAVEKALKPITAKYLTALKRLKAKLAKEQKLEEALAVDAVIKELVGGKAYSPLNP